MSLGDNLRSGGQILVDCLKTHGVELAFAVPGESYLAALDAFYDTPDIRLVTCRQEGGAAMMAEAYGKMTGRPGICFVTRGPGATNASAGVHIARQDSTPMILFIGQVGRDMVEREAFQEIDYRRMYSQMSKWVSQIDDPARIPEYVSRAFHVATSGRCGPVVLALPEDMLRERAAAETGLCYRPSQAYPAPAAMQELHGLLKTAQKPLVLLGEGDWDKQACEDLRQFISTNQLPVAASFRCQDIFDNTLANYIGDVGIGPNPKLADYVKQADLLLAIGGRLGEMTSGGYNLFDIPLPKQNLIHVHGGTEELNRVYQARLAINSGLKNFVAAAKILSPVEAPVWTDKLKKLRAHYLNWIKPPQVPGKLQMGQIINWLRENLADDAIICNGAGNYTVWVHRFYQYKTFKSQLAPTSGSMGYGLPAAVSAKIQAPEQTVICFAGDGCYQMTMQEFGTAVHYGANIIVLVINNGSWGTIRMHQEREYPGRVIATDLINPDFAALARAYGGHGAIVEHTEEFADAFQAAQAAGKPALLELRLDLEALTPKASLSEIRQTALDAGR